MMLLGMIFSNIKVFTKLFIYKLTKKILESQSFFHGPVLHIKIVSRRSEKLSQHNDEIVVQTC